MLLAVLYAGFKLVAAKVYLGPRRLLALYALYYLLPAYSTNARSILQINRVTPQQVDLALLGPGFNGRLDARLDRDAKLLSRTLPCWPSYVEYHRDLGSVQASKSGRDLMWAPLEEVSEEELAAAMQQVREGLVEGDDESRVSTGCCSNRVRERPVVASSLNQSCLLSRTL